MVLHTVFLTGLCHFATQMKYLLVPEELIVITPLCRLCHWISTALQVTEMHRMASFLISFIYVIKYSYKIFRSSIN